MKTKPLTDKQIKFFHTLIKRVRDLSQVNDIIEISNAMNILEKLFNQEVNALQDKAWEVAIEDIAEEKAP